MTTPQQTQQGLPWWWFLPYLSVLTVFTAMIAILVAVGVTPVLAVGVPVTLSIAAVSALTRIATINPVSGGRDHLQNTSLARAAIETADEGIDGEPSANTADDERTR